MAASPHWTETFFDDEYGRVWGFPAPETTAAEIAGLEGILPPPPAAVLDVACGNGRHAIALAAKGYRMTGVDIARCFLERARATAAAAAVNVHFHQGDMRAIDLHGFDAVIVLGNSFGYHSDDDNLASLTCMARAVRKGGRVVVETLNRDRIVANYAPHADHTGAGGAVIHVESTLDPVTGVNTVDHRWTGTDGRPHRAQTHQRLYTPPELTTLCRAAGLEPIAWHDGTSGEPFHLFARRLLLVAERARV